MNFGELIDLLGRRTDSGEVVRFAEANGVKLPLKATTDSNDSNYFSLKACGLEVSWSHQVLRTDFYPPKKENKKYVCYITSIWFERAKIEALPDGLCAGDGFDDAVLKFKSGAHEIVQSGQDKLLKFSLPHYPDIDIFLHESGDSKVHMSIRSCDRHAFLKSDVRAHAFSPWDNSWPNEQADLPTGMFMAWCIQRGWVGERHLTQNRQLVEAVKLRQMTGREFLYQTAFCNELWSHDIAAEVEDFAFGYLNCLCNRNSSQPLLGDPTRCGVDDDFMAVFDPLFSKRGLCAADDWGNYDRFALFLDARWYDYQKTALETDVDDPAVLEDVKACYKAQQLKMQALPPAVEITTDSTGTKSRDLAQSTATTLLSFLGRCVEDADIKSFLEAHNLSYPTVSWKTWVDAPTSGFFLGLDYPWRFGGERFKTLFDEKEQARMKRKKVKYVEEVCFTNAGYEQVSNSTGNYLLCSRFVPQLPFGLHWHMELGVLDQRLGGDSFGEHTWDTYENDGSLTRKWTVTPDGKSFSGSSDAPHYLLLVKFVKFRMMQVRVIVR